MQPGEKTRAPLRTGESDGAMTSFQLRLTVVFHPDRARIGASLTLGVLTASGVLHLDETARRLGLSRGALWRRVENIPGVRLSSDCSDAEIQMALEAVGRNLQALSRELRLSKASVASRLRLLGAGK